MSCKQKYKKFLCLGIFLIFPLHFAFSQAGICPRAQGMGDAYSAVARGFYAVNYNPANLAFTSQPRNYIQVGGINTSFTNNFFSIEKKGKYGGKDLTKNEAELQKEFISDLPEKGWRGNQDILLPLPFANFSFGNKAFTTNLIYTGDYFVSRPFLDVIFGNMEKGQTYDMELRCDAMTAVEYGYSMGIPLENFAWGFTVKYIQGLGYYGINPKMNTGSISVDTSDFIMNGSGQYNFRTSHQGRGFSFDLGVSFEDLYGWDFGFSVRNIGALIKWNESNILSKIFSYFPLQIMEWQFKTWNTDVQHNFVDQDYEYGFTVNDVNNLGGRFFEGDSVYEDFFSSDESIIDKDTADVFNIRLPLVIGIGMARQVSDNLFFAMDFSSTFQDRFNYRKGWRCAFGLEYTYFPALPMRFGMSLGGISGWQLNLGSGLKIGAIHLDWAIGMHRGMWIHNMQGFSFSLGTYITPGRKKNKKIAE